MFLKKDIKNKNDFIIKLFDALPYVLILSATVLFVLFDKDKNLFMNYIFVEDLGIALITAGLILFLLQNKR